MENKKKLREGLFVVYEYDKETAQNKKLLYPIWKAARNRIQGNIIQEEMQIGRGCPKPEKKKCTTKNIGKLPAELIGFHMSSKWNNNTYDFLGELNPFSNFHPSPFTIGEIRYKTSEHYIPAERAGIMVTHWTQHPK